MYHGDQRPFVSLFAFALKIPFVKICLIFSIGSRLSGRFSQAFLKLSDKLGPAIEANHGR
jgi:hypothetical protein